MLTPRSLLTPIALAASLAPASGLVLDTRADLSRFSAQPPANVPANGGDQQASDPAPGAPSTSGGPDSMKPSAAITIPWRHTFRAKFDENRPGKVAIDRLGVDVNLRFPVNQQFSVGLSSGWEWSRYTFRDATAFNAAFTKPWSDVHILSLGTSLNFATSDQTRWFVGAGVRSSGERGAEFGDTITVNGLAGGSYSFNENFTLGGGLVVSSRIEDNVQIIPILIVDWKISDWLRFSTMRTRPGVRLTVTPAEWFSFGPEVSYESREFRLRDDKTNPGTRSSPGGVVRDRRLPVGAFATFNFSRQFSLELSGGVELAQRYRFEDRQGNKVTGVETKPAGYLGLELSLRF